MDNYLILQRTVTSAEAFGMSKNFILVEYIEGKAALNTLLNTHPEYTSKEMYLIVKASDAEINMPPSDWKYV